MKKIRKITFVLAAVICLGAINSLPVAATNTADKIDVYGGWSEETGYFKSAQAFNNSLVVRAAAEAKHSGERLTDNSGSTTKHAAHGWTTWVGEYHYTRARMEEHFLWKERILTDSNRVWGTNGTEATSPWWSFDPSVNDSARTYYGK